MPGPDPVSLTPSSLTPDNFIHHDIVNIKSLLFALKSVLLEGFKVEDENENFDNLESEELLSVANVIDKLSLHANIINDNENSDEEDSECVKDITNKAIRQTVEENEDLKRQNILLEQQLEEKERRIKALERLLLTEEKSQFSLTNGRKSFSVNTATQTERMHSRTSSLDRNYALNNINNNMRSRSLKVDETKRSPSMKMLPPTSRSTSSANLANLREKLHSVKNGSSSSSTSYLPSPVTPRRRFLLNGSDQDKLKTGNSLGSSNYTSSTNSTSYLLSPRPVRSKSSNEGCQTMVESNRHGWLYTQSSFKFHNRAFKPTIL